MSVQSRQALRLMKFVAEMRKNNYPNASKFARLLRDADVDENIPCACSTRTIMRDIETLQRDYNAPIEYDAVQRGYFLRDKNWSFAAPVLDDNILSMALLGTKLSSDILPEPVKQNVNTAVEKMLTEQSSSFFDQAMIESLLCATGIKAAVDPVVFKKVFDGWRLHQMLAFDYRKPDGSISRRFFEPHIIAFHKGIWYAKGYEWRTKNVKCYAIQRIADAAFGGDTFDTDKKLVAETQINGLFEYPKLDAVQLKCDASTAFYLYEHQKSRKFKIEHQSDGSLIVTLKPSFEHDVIRWVLGESGKIEVIYPQSLRKKIASLGKLIWEKHQEKTHSRRRSAKSE
ncbi:MAG: WYL domain-containing protein [Victivallaceae bacterium]|nr:WYL domain-containing protein [Victivallaceae bacterium]